MEMTIEDIIQGLKEIIIICNSVFAYDRKKYIDGAIETMRKYQKIEQIVKEWEFDHESMVDSMEKISEVLEDGNVD